MFSALSVLFLILCSFVVGFLLFPLWWEYWGQFMFNRIIIQKEEGGLNENIKKK